MSHLQSVPAKRGFATKRKLACSTSGCAQSFTVDRRRVGNLKCPACGQVQRIRRP